MLRVSSCGKRCQYNILVWELWEGCVEHMSRTVLAGATGITSLTCQWRLCHWPTSRSQSTPQCSRFTRSSNYSMAMSRRIQSISGKWSCMITTKKVRLRSNSIAANTWRYRNRFSRLCFQIQYKHLQVHESSTWPSLVLKLTYYWWWIKYSLFCGFRFSIELYGSSEIAFAAHSEYAKMS